MYSSMLEIITFMFYCTFYFCISVHKLKISGKWFCVKYTTVCCANSYMCRVDDVNLHTNSDVCIVSAVKST